ncbi:ZYRO0G10098p [Zygosaccharomyces rouxii]|uniref:Actin cytoskeleton-regulatory complex protein SLA1 n=1 Tax=Zygosaccharomyces rouxii (strain ATCC 2623 / CBS 732 / NBRC 1130 / NCYC 568 / NRRL Y-229) TaxID=559307 RepID=C5E064_ZYGRC|nr:uncharacterized protein ZYRO0G10098g [Zygosaccharomyces rouxii]KAH9202493.1 hypothetical protein LQ764DRAFT_25948 [Zygosaccharomyces rouxii]CAR29498.1 ZYRO0G10098p [Zygosaccharomyces rouxii]
MTVFIGVVKALYDYEPQTDEELAIKEDDILYLLEKSDVDEWWTVKKRVIGLDAEEPTGLVPSNYVEPANVIGTVRALYDYEEAQNPDEEITFLENELFDLFDDQDQDWLLVQSKSSGAYGFIPGNYVEPAQGAPTTPAAAPAPAPIAPPGPTPIAPPIMTPAGADELPPPPQPQRPGREPEDVTPALPKRPRDQEPPLPEPPLPPMRDEEEPPLPSRPRDRVDEDEDEELPPPPKPVRPTSTGGGPSLGGLAGAGTERDDYRLGRRVESEDDYEDDNYGGGYNDMGLNSSDHHTWSIAEVDGRKKKKCKLTVGGSKIYFEPSDGPHEEWTIDNLTTYDNEKKHIFLEFVKPYRSLELHAGSTDTCNEIMSILGEYKGAQRDPGIREIEEASKPKKEANVVHDFRAEADDELTVRQGQVVYIINDKKSRDWWLCELVSNGQRGIVPADCLESVKEKSSSSGFFGSLRKITGNTDKYNAKQNAKQASHKERDRERERLKNGSHARNHGRSESGSWKDDEAQSLNSVSNERRNTDRRRSNSMSAKKSSSGSTSKSQFPDPKKTRIWADRSNTFKVEAQFIGCTEGKIHLHKANGVKIAVAAGKLSDEDLVYVERTTGFSLDKFKSRSSEGSDEKRKRSTRDQDDEERDRYLREKELEELRKARELLDEERTRMQELTEKKPAKPPRPQTTGGTNTMTLNYQPQYDWFEFFLNCGVDVNNCQRYTINFEREKITEDMMKDINEPMLRTLGLREGDIVRVMKYLDKKFDREPKLPQGQATGGMFSQPDGSLKVSNADVSPAPPLTQNLLPQATGAAVAQPTQASQTPLETAIPNATRNADDDAWTSKPAAKSESSVLDKNNNSNFTGSMQDLIDLRPLEPKKKEPTAAPEPNLKDLEPVKTGGETKAAPLSSAPTGGTTLQPLDPFKTGGNNLLPLTTGFVMMPVATGGLMPMQRTGGLAMPQTTFGNQNMDGLMQPQKTNSALMPMGLQTTGGLKPQVTNPSLAPMNFQTTGSMLQPQRTNPGLIPIGTGGAMQPQGNSNMISMGTTGGGMMPQTTFGSQPMSQPMGASMPLQTTGGTMPRLGSVLPVQKTGSGILPLQPTGSAMPMQATGSAMHFQGTGGFIPFQRTGGMPQQPTGNLIPLQRTGGNMMPQTSFGANVTGGANMMPQTSFGANVTGGANMMPQTSFGTNVTGGANMMPQTSFGGPQLTGTGNMMPQTSFGGPQLTGAGNMMPQTSFGANVTGGPNMMPQSSFGAQQMTGGANMMPQTNFGGSQISGGFPQTSFGSGAQGTGGYPGMVQSVPQMTGGFQQNGHFGSQNQFTGGPMPQQSFPGSSFNSGVDNATQGMQNMSLSQAPLQAQPTGFGFGNGPQQPQQPQQHGAKQANLFNATPDNPFGF